MKIYKTTNVFEESLKRIRRLFDEFEEVWVSVSGGKDSTVVYELTKIVAREKGRLPLKVMFLDQEAEYQATIDLIEEMMYDDEVEPYWLQVPIKLFNATSNKQEWLECWEEGAKWMREKDPISYKENVWGADRFHDMFDRFIVKEAKDKKVCWVTGVRTEESPARFLGLTNTPKYKDITWGKKNDYSDNIFTFHPIYDWSYSDVWKAIHENGWSYNKIYDYQYRYGIPLMEMRVSNLHHETAVHSLFWLQEAEPDTYEKLTERVRGVDTAGKMGKDDYFIKDLPYMFKDWKEYRDFLLEKMINPKYQKRLKRKFNTQERRFGKVIPPERMFKAHIQVILTNDYHGTKLGNLRNRWNIALKDHQRKAEQNADKT